MTIKQKIMGAVYPALITLTKLAGKNSTVLYNEKKAAPVTQVYNLRFLLNNGKEQSLEFYKGKKILFVNTASDCGYTAQYAELQQLHLQYGNKVTVLGFPANDFGEQERGDDAGIEQFCTINFGVTFPLAKKSVVVKNETQNEVYQWLSREQQNGWNTKAPGWNFCKYLVNEAGVLTHYFDPSVAPLSAEILNAINESG